MARVVGQPQVLLLSLWHPDSLQEKLCDPWLPYTKGSGPSDSRLTWFKVFCIFGFQGPVWQVLWVSPCLGTASLGTLSTLPPGWNPQGCVSVSNSYPAWGSLSQQHQTGYGKQDLVTVSPNW